MDEIVLTIVKSSVELALLLVVLIGFYRLLDRMIGIHESFLGNLVQQIERIANDIEDYVRQFNRESGEP